MADKVFLLSGWASPFGMRVSIALSEKGVQYHYKEQNVLQDKSPLLLQMNPIHKKIPVLIHNGKPFCESLIIVQYIDETWKDDKAPLLPSDTYQRAQARFWADYIEQKVVISMRAILRNSKGEEQEKAKKECIEALKVLEEELGDKPYFGGDDFGFVDLNFVPFYSWFYAVETLVNVSEEAECPKLIEWGKRCMQKKSVANSLPDPIKVYDLALQLRKKIGVA